MSFGFWVDKGLQCDPYRFSDDYQIASMNNFLQHRTGGRGFDALKWLRLNAANLWWSAVPEGLKNDALAKMIAQSVNYATGITKNRFFGGEKASWVLFAPKLEGSRWGWLVRDPLKAMSIFTSKNATPQERYWATTILKQRAAVVGMYAGMLALNQGLLLAMHSKQSVNATDPRKPDFLAFKVAGLDVGLMGPMIGMLKLAANLIHSGQGAQSRFEKLESRQHQMAIDMWRYGRGKLSPFASFGVDIFSRQSAIGRPLPWSPDRPTRAQARRGLTKYEGKEWAEEQFSPIPIQELVKDVWKMQGMTDNQADTWFKRIIIVGGMGGTGAHIRRDERAAP